MSAPWTYVFRIYCTSAGTSSISYLDPKSVSTNQALGTKIGVSNTHGFCSTVHYLVGTKGGF